MTRVNIRPLPNARVPYDDAKDPAVRQKVMLLNDNISSLKGQLAETQRAVIELQKKPSGGGGDAEYWARVAQQAAGQSQDASSSASGHASTAASAKNDAVAAKNAAVAAKESAEEAARSISGFIKVKEFTTTVNVPAGSAASYSAYVYPDDEIGEGYVPILAVCAYSGYQKLCATRCEVSNSTGRWTVGVYLYNIDSESHSGIMRVKVLYAKAS